MADLVLLSFSHYGIYSVITAHNLTPVKHDDWSTSRAHGYITRCLAQNSINQSQPWNKYFSAAYCASLHSQTVLKCIPFHDNST